jgi:hypothetical protein
MYERAEDGHLIAELDDAVSEHLRNTHSGLEQSWHIDAKPDGSGDLVVRIAVSGERYLARTQTGLHFQDPDSGLGISYSDATWIDANGNETEVVASYEQGQIVMAVPADVVERSAYPAVLDPTVGAEFALDSPIYVPAPDVQSGPAIAHSGNDQMLVVWQDRRRTLNLAFDLYAAHVSTNGIISEPVGFLVTDPNDNLNHTAPAAVWDGGNFVIVFVSKDAQGASHIRARVIQGALSTTPMPSDSNNFDGNLGDSGYCGATSNCTDPDIAWNAYTDYGRYFVTWEDNVNGVNKLWGTAFRATTLPTFTRESGPNEINQNNNGGDGGRDGKVAGSMPEVGFYGENFLVVFTVGDHKVYARDYNKQGLFVHPVKTVLQGQNPNKLMYDPDVAFFGASGSWLVVSEYDISGNGTNFDIRGVGVRTSDLATSGWGNVAATTALEVRPSVAGYGTNGLQALVTWGNFPCVSCDGSVYAARVQTTTSNALTFLDPPGINVGGNVVTGSGAIAVHSNDGAFPPPGRYLLAWNDKRTSAFYDIYGARIDFNGALLDPSGGFLISKAANRQTAPAIARCGNKYLVAWTDNRNGETNTDIYGTILDNGGSILLQNIQIAYAPGNQDLPAVACDGSTGNFFVVWEDQRNGNKDIYGTAIDANTGARLNGAGVAITTTTAAESHPTLAYSPAVPGFLVAWDSTTTTSAIYGLKMDSGGFVGPVALIDSFENASLYPDVDWDGANFTVVFQSNATGDGNIYAHQVSPGIVVGPLITVENAIGIQRYPKIRWDGGNYLIVFEDDRNVATNGTDIYARQMKNTGGVLAGFAIATTANNERAPALSFRPGPALEVAYWRAPTSATFDYDIWAQGVTTAGTLNGAAYTVSATTGAREWTPAIACGFSLTGGSSCVTPYRSFNPADTSTGTDRIKARFVTYP